MRIDLSRFRVKTLCTLVLLAPAANGGDPPTDAELAQRVQTVLTADRVLKSRSLVVSVVDGVAVVGGPVASADEAARVRQLLRVVPGLTDAKVSAWVPAVEDPLKQKVAERLKARDVPTVVASADPRPSGRVVVQRYAPPAAATPLLLEQPAAQGQKPLPSRTDAAYSPVPGPPPAAPDGPPQYPTIPSPAVPTTPMDDVESAVEVVKAGDPRFAGLSARVSAGVVTIDGAVTEAEDAWAFAAGVRKVPGVDRVLLGRISVR